MATSKKTKIDGYFFMSICNGELDVNCSGDEDIISAAFATIFLDETKEGEQAKQILATAAAIAAHEMQSKKDILAPLKEKYSSKTPTKTAKKK
jgi:hypothetical protein